MTFRSFILVAAVGAATLATGCVNTVDDSADQQGDDVTARGKSKITPKGSCESPKGQTQYCGGKTKTGGGNCYCDDKCAKYGDCCDDKVDVCGGKGNPVCTDDPLANYIGKPSQCPVIKFTCVKGMEPFSDDCGCGCKPIEEKCGGIAGKQCSSFLKYCDFGATCGAGDQMGVCKPAGDVCAQVYEPVCGCDGKTYGNACEASRSHMSVVHKGECGPSANTCGGKLGKTCAKGEFCNYANNTCGAADQTGTCEPRPDACIELYKPVCGCDGKTYGNSCKAQSAGSSVSHDGPCEQPKCGDSVCGANQWCSYCWGKMACIPKGAFC